MPPALAPPVPPDLDNALAAFDTTTRAWFEGRFGKPTRVQCLAWPRIAAGEHVLATAPTGHPELERYLGFLKNLLTRHGEPLKAVDLSEINGAPAADSDYAPMFRRLFQATREGPSLRLRRRYRPEARGPARGESG